MLRIGALAPFGLSLGSMLASSSQVSAKASQTHTGSKFGKAKRCLMIYMWGGPAHQDLYDLKPDAPSEYRGEFDPIRTNVPGMQITELMPHLARQMDKIGLIRSVTHNDNNHSTSAHWMMTGHRHERSAENFGARQSDFPHIGSVISKLAPVDSHLPTLTRMTILATTSTINSSPAKKVSSSHTAKVTKPNSLSNSTSRNHFSFPTVLMQSTHQFRPSNK